jgi:dTMP kinase
VSLGIFITFEGSDGSGKTTQAEMLSSAVMNLHPVVLREPGGTEMGERIRELLLHAPMEMTAEAEMYLFLAARAELVERVIKPALEHDRIVIADRYHDSTLAYQGGGRNLDVQWPASFPRPDVTFLFEIDPALGLERAGKATADRMESETFAFHEAVSAAYHRLAMEEPNRFVVLDGTQAIETIHEQVVSRVKTLLAERGAESEAQLHGAHRRS